MSCIAHPLNKLAMATGSDGDVQDLGPLIESSLVDTSQCLSWDRIYMCPAVKLRIKTAPTATKRNNTVTRLERSTCNGMLLFGRPGTGKSVLTYAMAAEFWFKLYEVDMADINSKWQEDSEKCVMTIFRHCA